MFCKVLIKIAQYDREIIQMPIYDFRTIGSIPNGKDLVDIVLSKTQRKTPTVIRKTMKICRIRAFYMLKVKFTQNTIGQKISAIVDEFPKIDEIHPFYRYWFNIMYDKDHFKIALGQLHQCKNLTDKVGKHYVKLLKHADSLFQCKTLKRAALGRMISLLRKQNEYLAYLEQVRQHMSRLPSIDPSTRTLLLTGYPSVGKSSLLNALTRANVEVESWDFTTQSLFVGHSDYKGLGYQLIDTPGLLDHPLEERNNIELQAIAALAYLNAAILFLIDLSCGGDYLQKQVHLFQSMKLFFQNKPTVIVLSKADLWTPDQLSADDIQLIQSMSPTVSLPEALKLYDILYPSRAEIDDCLARGGELSLGIQARVKEEDELRQRILAQAVSGAPLFIPASTMNMQGVERAMAVACEQLLQVREAQLFTARKQELLADRQYVANPIQRDNKQRVTYIPESVKALQEAHMPVRAHTVEDGFISERVLELENGGARVYKPDERKNWLLSNDDWKYDPIPYFYKGKNIMDFITVDEDIDEKLRLLEEEEERLVAAESAFDDRGLFEKLALYRELTDNRRIKKATLKGMDLLGSSMPRLAQIHGAAAGAKLDRFVMKKTGQKFSSSVATTVFPNPNRPMKDKWRSLQERMEEQARKDGVSVEQMQRIDYQDKHYTGKGRFDYKKPAVTRQKHLLSGKISGQARDRR